ncbi:uncharacterized protein [Primulina eburnea]|uniref:uncharacterized protein n=1 Tax=Primulina eburnea TaxID=1245227 RepID=UPI003C6C69E0
MAMTLWSIWHYRNDKLWNGVDRAATINLSLASDLLQQWQLARPQLHPMNPDEANLRWTRLPAGSMKCNVDAAIFKEINKIGGAAIIRDSAGEFMMCSRAGAIVTEGYSKSVKRKQRRYLRLFLGLHP